MNKGGSTLFAPLKETLDSLPTEEQLLWERLWFITDGGVIHPLVYRHPCTQLPTLCFHCGPHFVKTFAVDYNTTTGEAAGVLSDQQVTPLLGYR